MTEMFDDPELETTERDFRPKAYPRRRRASGTRFCGRSALAIPGKRAQPSAAWDLAASPPTSSTTMEIKSVTTAQFVVLSRRVRQIVLR